LIQLPDVALKRQRRHVVKRDVAGEQDAVLRQERDGVADRVGSEAGMPEVDLRDRRRAAPMRLSKRHDGRMTWSLGTRRRTAA